ncbi:TonB-dependent siderophore receptor [Herminiimonas arsenitoxidans]|uniref:TonB-dependent siderophore receptor n=1 Tax=Herminiimonas arsenitoxidans TaxID=1809410 RepID=UPI000970E309|nr:TonB-dependent siderophore receptor [Herminiimonas arsenitoxidans]
MYVSNLQLRPSITAIRLALFLLSTTGVISSANAQESDSQQTAAEHSVLPQIQVIGVNQDGFSTQTVSTTKSDKPLFETPQSISVVTRELMDARQATTLDEAIETVAGVTSSTLGRRGWDDFMIRGQSASDTMYLDGLRIGQANWVAQEIYGAERIEVVKGPASIYFGQVTPGGTVNVISKRPRAEAFNQVGFTVGNYGYLQGTFDFGRPLNSENGKAAFRVNGMAMNSDDPTDGVWYRNRYIAPSISLDLGARTDFTILAAINQRNYVRQQGLPVAATSLVNNGISVPQSFFTGDYTVAPYDAEQKSIGYVLTHRFDNGWTLNQTYRHLDMDMTGQLANITSAPNAAGNFSRNVLSQNFSGRSDGLDTNIAKTFNWGGLKHNVMVGVDVMYDKLYKDSKRCSIAAQNIYNPVYGRAVTACGYQNDIGIADITLAQNGLYLRDYIEFNEQLSMSMSLRHDKARLSTVYPLKSVPTVTATANTNTNTENSANTGHVGFVYKATQNVAPYISYATSFLPQTETTFGGNPIKPEEGKQAEIGVKFLSDDKRLSASLAYYDLKRRNVSQTDDANPLYKIAIGEQTTKGYEAEIAADLKNGWQLSGALSVLDAVITEASAGQFGTVGQRLPNVARKTANFLANYRFTGALEGWGAGFGVRYVGAKTATNNAYTVPSYTVADANVSYQGQGYRVQLNIKNLFDKEYFAGASSANWVPVGNPRTVMLKTVFDF